MSDKGKLLRGEKWYNLRDRDGKLPEEVTKDPAKMADIEVFLANKKEVAPVSESKTSGEGKKARHRG